MDEFSRCMHQSRSNFKYTVHFVVLFHHRSVIPVGSFQHSVFKLIYLYSFQWKFSHLSAPAWLPKRTFMWNSIYYCYSWVSKQFLFLTIHAQVDVIFSTLRRPLTLYLMKGFFLKPNIINGITRKLNNWLRVSRKHRHRKYRRQTSKTQTLKRQTSKTQTSDVENKQCKSVQALEH